MNAVEFFNNDRYAKMTGIDSEKSLTDEMNFLTERNDLGGNNTLILDKVYSSI